MEPPRRGTCSNCSTRDAGLDEVLFSVFDLNVCLDCKAPPDRLNRRTDPSVDPNPTHQFGFLTQSEAHQYYLVTKDMLQQLNYVEKPNQRNAKFKPMKLYLRKEIQRISQANFPDLARVKADRKKRQFEMKLKKNKRVFQQERMNKHIDDAVRKRIKAGPSSSHTHTFIVDSGASCKRCQGCGLEVECEVL